ncbi:hypothetical protein [Pedobacter nyackensis]|uniref:Lipocalin-like domain-containing protein n=1 Tax=Pedobacter nyackensis TaxID=475255 RepID=A0A1W2A2N4_9SPHI|nr:hypothetical protein [Pedobacter nyackensis]SMC54701.1 hypothetical protein SAMN04488101_101263 [Pedobacter nyackensis]
MKIFKLIVITIICATAISWRTAPNDKYSGNWVLNKEKSDIKTSPDFKFPEAINLALTKDSVFQYSVINQGDKLVKTKTTSSALSGAKREKVISEKEKLISSFAWDDSKNRLIKKQILVTNDAESKILTTVEESWTISEDGTRLTLIHNRKSQNDPANTYVVTGVFNKQIAN